jgi:hypothetical protein
LELRGLYRDISTLSAGNIAIIAEEDNLISKAYIRFSYRNVVQGYIAILYAYKGLVMAVGKL